MPAQSKPHLEEDTAIGELKESVKSGIITAIEKFATDVPERICLALEIREGRQATLLGIRVGLMFLIASSILVVASYVVLSQNFERQLTDYTLKLVTSMLEQGVTTVEYELQVSREQVAALAGAFSVPGGEEQVVKFPTVYSKTNYLRMVYVSQDRAVASDGRPREIHTRPDILQAFQGETAVYGPYFNDEDEYVICYSAPVVRDGQVAGVLSVEKDGYYFCSLIQSIRFMDTGESYIINAQGTDIAVSDPNHISWVNEQYNAKQILAQQEDPVTRSILELEQRGLDGERGMGTYVWEDGLCYLVYMPIPSEQWVLLGGLREEELSKMTQSTLYASIAEGPTLSICVGIFLMLTAVIVYWIVSSLQKSAEINKNLKTIAHYDALTGTMNRNSYHAALDALEAGECSCLACLYIDANGLHELNNHLGHAAGDQMLKAVADVFRRHFSSGQIYRIGGDEFVVLCQDRQEITHEAQLAREELRRMGYEVSVGIAWREKHMEIKDVVNAAEDEMQRDKQRYYQENGQERQLRTLNQELEQMLLAKQDADTFLSVLAPEFKGVYFVNLGRDTIRHLYVPSYFEEILEETDDKFSQALRLYAKRIVAPDYQRHFDGFYNYDSLEAQLDSGEASQLIYQKKDGAWIKLQVLKFKTYTRQNRETLWIFSNVQAPERAV